MLLFIIFYSNFEDIFCQVTPNTKMIITHVIIRYRIACVSLNFETNQKNKQNIKPFSIKMGHFIFKERSSYKPMYKIFKSFCQTNKQKPSSH